MQTAFLVTTTSVLISTSASAAFVGYTVTATTIASAGQGFVRYQLFANFNSANDRAINVFNLSLAAGSTSAALCGFINPDESWASPVPSTASVDSFLMWGNTTTPLSISPSVTGDCLVTGLGWSSSNPPSSPPPTPSFQLAQFVLPSSDPVTRAFNLKITYTSGFSSPIQFGEASFTLPTPSALALLGLAGLTRRSRR
jgi:hypothetical protein